MQLGERDVSRIVSAGRRALACSAVAELQHESVSALDKLIGTSLCVFFLDPEHRNGTDHRLVTNGLKAEFESAYHTRFDSNPYRDWIRAMRNRWTRPVALPRELLSRARDTAFYSDFMVPLGMHHTMMIGLTRNGEYLGLVALARAANDRPFGKIERAKAELMAPMLQGALERTLREEQLEEWGWIAESLDPALAAAGVIVLDDDLKVRYRNHVATELMLKLRSSSERNFDPNPRQLPRILHSRCADFAAKARPEIRSAFEIDSHGAGCVIGVQLRQVDNGARRGYLVSLAPESPVVSHDERMRRLGLTDREIDIVVALGTGLTNQQIADRLCISFFTVQSHLKSVYRKLGVRNRAGVLQRVFQVA